MDVKRRKIEAIPSLKKIVNEITKDEEYEKNLVNLLSLRVNVYNIMISFQPAKDGIKYKSVQVIIFK